MLFCSRLMMETISIHHQWAYAIRPYMAVVAHGMPRSEGRQTNTQM